jgi:hypothetical protein
MFSTTALGAPLNRNVGRLDDRFGSDHLDLYLYARLRGHEAGAADHSRGGWLVVCPVRRPSR